MSGIPVCPYCDASLGEPIPSVIHGTIHLRCPSCGRLYGYAEEIGIFPIDEEFDYHLSPGLFGKRIMIGSYKEQSYSEPSSRRLSWLCPCFVSPILILLIFIAISYLLSMMNP